VKESDVELSVLMPVFDERATIEQAIQSVLDAQPASSYELIVVDDGSRDGTAELLRERSWPSNVHVLHRDRNGGKGAALRTALQQARGRFSAVHDADLEYSPADIPALLGPLRDGEQAVFGARGFRSHSAYSFWYVVGNRFVTFLANLLYNSWLSDIMTGQKAMVTELFRSLDLREPGFGIEPEITARLLRRGIPIYEVPVQYRARTREEGKKLTARDGLHVVRTLLRCRVS
jgi:glycosyltransferase involved in cell wall biosynthesis